MSPGILGGGYARDVLDHAEICLSENPPTDAAKAMAEIVEGRSFHNVSSKDRRLLLDAAAAECDHFLTIEKRLPRQAPMVLKRIPLLICTPMTLWEKLTPYVRNL